jgi:hypothetical protein
VRRPQISLGICFKLHIYNVSLKNKPGDQEVRGSCFCWDKSTRKSFRWFCVIPGKCSGSNVDWNTATCFHVLTPRLS